MKKTLGIIGGMGPLATAKLFERIILLTDAKSDQEHLHIIIDNNTSIPDRTAYILEGGPDPRKELIDSAVKLQNMGADFLIIPCNTAHYFYEDIVAKIDIPILSMIDETAKYIKDNYLNIRNIGLLATEGTYKAEVFDNIFHKYGIDIIKPSKEKQKYIMELIYNIKKGVKQKDLSGFYSAMKEIEEHYTDIFVVGCTELSVALEMYDLQGKYINPIDIIAKKAIEFAGGKVLS